MEEKIELSKYIPKKVICGKNQNKYPLTVEIKSDRIILSYHTKLSNQIGPCATRKYSCIIPKTISKNQENYEVLGLLQAEMGKTQNGCITFPNSEPKIINKVIRFFEKEFDIPKTWWRWYLAVNIKEPQDKEYKNQIEKKVLNYWVRKTPLKLNQSNPKKVTYRKVEHTKLKEYYYGCLMIEYKDNIYSQIIKIFLKNTTSNMKLENTDNIRAFMRGLIAGEGCIECHKETKKYRVHISVTDPKEKINYVNLLKELNIKAYNYKGDKIIVSKRKNNIQLLKQKLMTLHPRKYNKFLNMMKNYQGIEEETGYFTKEKTPWNKIPKETIDQVIEIKKKNPEISVKKAANLIGVSPIKISRVWKENNLGKRWNKTSEKIINNILKLCIIYRHVCDYQIAKKCKIHEGVVRRARKKYNMPKIYKPYSKEEFEETQIWFYENPTLRKL
tara:strand:- start:5182 stop:6510 length:1329 start_codon:yes stop_codon:yes gene_type:complete